MSDWPAVRAVHLAAFGAQRQVVGNLVDDLRDAVARGEGLSLVAEERDQIVGHVLFSSSLLDAPKRLVPVQVLSPNGVVPAYQKQGVGMALIRRGLELLIGRNVRVAPSLHDQSCCVCYAWFHTIQASTGDSFAG